MTSHRFLLAALHVLPGTALAQAYSARPIKIVTPFPAGLKLD